MVFKLYGKNGKCKMTWHFDDNKFANGFFVKGKRIFFSADTVIEVAEYPSHKYATEICNEIKHAYHTHRKYNLPL